MFRFISVFFCFLLSFSLFAEQPVFPRTELLQFNEGELIVEATWMSKPLSREWGSFLELQFKSGGDEPQPIEAPTDFDVVLMMPSMGHGSAPTKINPALDEDENPIVGKYLVDMCFVMGGSWEVEIILNPSEELSETQILKIEVGADHQHGSHRH